MTIKGEPAWLENWAIGASIRQLGGHMTVEIDRRVDRARCHPMVTGVITWASINEAIVGDHELRDRVPEWAILLAAAPALVRTALLTEWSGWCDYVGDGGVNACPACSGLCPQDESHDAETTRASHPESFGHRPSCAVDDALCAAGFPDAPSREAARQRILAKRASDGRGKGGAES